MDPDLLTREELIVDSADGGEIDESVLIDVFDHESDLITVAGQHDRRFAWAPSPNQSHGIPQDIGSDRIHAVLDIFPEKILDGLFITRGARGFTYGF